MDTTSLTPIIPWFFLELVDLLGRSAKDHGTLVIIQCCHPAHALDNATPPRPGIVIVGSADGPVAAKHNAARAKGSKDDTEPTKSGLEDVVGVLLSQGVRHLREAARELHVDVGIFAEGVDGGAPGVETWVGCDIDDAKVRFAEMV